MIRYKEYLVHSECLINVSNLPYCFVTFRSMYSFSQSFILQILINMHVPSTVVIKYSSLLKHLFLNMLTSFQ